MKQHLSHSESIARTSEMNDSGNRFNIHYLQGADFPTGDKVIVEVITRTGENVMDGGDPLQLRVVQGFGHLALEQMPDGEKRSVFLEPGVELTVPTNDMYYRVTNLGEEPVAYLDYCEGFDPSNEPSLAEWQARQANK